MLLHRRPDWAALVALPAALAWLYSGILVGEMRETHESPDIYLRVEGYLAEFRAGQWPPRVLPEAFGGAGHAFPRFYPPLAYWAAAGAAAWTGDSVRGVHAAFLLSVLLSAAAFHGMATELTRSRTLAFLGAVLYCAANYRLRDVFQRGALAECWTLVWYPLLVLGIHRAARTGVVPRWLPLVVAALLLTHTVMAGYVITLGLLYVAASILQHKARTLRSLRQTAATLLLAGGLAAWHLAPAWASWEDVRAADSILMLGTDRQVEQRRVSLDQLLHGVPGVARDPRATSPRDRFRLGHADVALLPLFSIALFAAVAARRRGAPGPAFTLATSATVVALWLLVVGFVIAPGPALRVLPPEFGMIQFAWRLLGPAAFLSSLGVVLLLRDVGAMLPRPPPLAGPAAALLAALVLATVPAGSRHGAPFDTTRSTRADRIAAAADRGYTVRSEYAPRRFTGAARLDAARRELARTRSVRSVQREGSTTRLHVTTAAPTFLTLPILYYDFYAARLADGSRARTSECDGLLRVHLDPGDHTVEISPGGTAASRTGLGISVLSLLVLLAPRSAVRYRIRASLRVSATSPDVSRTK